MKTKKILTKVLSIALVCVMLVMCMGAGYGEDVIFTNEAGYAELRHQVNLNNISIELNSHGKIEAKNNARNIFSGFMVNDDVQKLNVLFDRYKEVASALKDSTQKSNQIVAIGVTEAPLENIDGKLLRVSSRNYPPKEESSVSNRYYFSLWTIVEKSIYTGEYNVTTRGAWSTNGSSVDGKYPDTGSDYILQSTPNTFVRKSDYLSTWYSAKDTGTEGFEYWKENGGANYIRYAVEEEASGLGYLESFSLGTVSADNGSPQNRIINSYYVHTWEELNISVSIGVNTKSEVSLEITPSIVKSAWQLYSYVSFSF